MSHHPRRWNVEGRTCCLHCRLMLRLPASVYDHARQIHPESIFDYTPRVVVKDRIGTDGRRFCYTRTPPKVVYDTNTAAWLNAQIIFAERGFILSPYFCYSTTHRAEGGSPKYIKGCGRWHLSRRVLRLAGGV